MNEKEAGNTDILGAMDKILGEANNTHPAQKEPVYKVEPKEEIVSPRPEVVVAPTRPRPTYGNEGEARRAAQAFEAAMTAPFPEQFCELCNVAYGLFMSAKRRVSSSRVLAAADMDRVKKMIPEHIQHLDECPANNGGFD